ncbi:MAG: hypothetical protein K5872_22215 [Rhizobiaceae bacterium]|nr:hypothetical protein [Rhizobiaceae bacterium]MCV0408936.1 hypothetical protein [Rhizobiaceae bacterium]
MTTSMIVRSTALDVVDVTLVADTNAYADNDVLAVPQEVHSVFLEAGGTRLLHSVMLLDEADQGQDIDLLFFNADATLGTINSAVSISDADARKLIGKVSIVQADYSDLVNSQFASKGDLNMVLKAADPSASLWIGAVVRSGTPTYAADSIKLKLGLA